VFLVFLEFREQAFIRAFFESGVVVPLMHALSVDFDVSDEACTFCRLPRGLVYTRLPRLVRSAT